MTTRRRFLLVGASFAAASAVGQPSAQLHWVAGDLPPYAWISPTGPQGYAHDLAVAMAQRLGRPASVNFLPWARAVKVTEEGDHFGVFPLARTPEREARFHWLIPLATVRYTFVGKSSPRQLQLEDLRPLVVGVLRGSPALRALQAEQFTRIVEAKDYKELLRLLSADTISVIYASAPMLEAAIETYGYSRAQFTRHVSLGEATLYMAASLQLPEEELGHWRRAYQQLEDDGTVARLRKQYLK